MSLFKYRELWRTQAGSEEHFHDECMIVDNIDNHPSGQGMRCTRVAAIWMSSMHTTPGCTQQNWL